MLCAAAARLRLVGFFAAALLGIGGLIYARAGRILPQLDEGDLVIQTTRAPDIALPAALREAGRLEATLLAAVPEVTQVVSRVGSQRWRPTSWGLSRPMSLSP